MIEIIVALLTSILPPCAVEDDPMCLGQDGDVLIVNLAPADPAPATFSFTANF